ncbi:hypothetical protein [Nocardia sp. SSK8]|uniref:hypothetical protein n=1 Tax=Nocardia sp. SSK8 TaxID=3120154 RepID=UPI00300A4841
MVPPPAAPVAHDATTSYPDAIPPHAAHEELTSYPDAVPPPAVPPVPAVGVPPYPAAAPAQPPVAAPTPYGGAGAPYAAGVPPYVAGGSPYPAGSYPPGAPYPGQPGVPTGPRAVPPSVQNAFYLMLAGACVTLLAMIYSFTVIDQTRSEVLDASGGVLRGADLDLVMSVSMGIGVGTSLITAGLWVWMAFASRAGKNWARITGTTFFGINAVMFLFGILAATFSSGLVLGHLFGAVGVAIGLATVILLWTGRSKEFFAPAPVGYAPYPGYPATGPW